MVLPIRMKLIDVHNVWKRLVVRASARDLPSRMPSARYDFWKGDLDLTYPVENSVDRELQAFFLGFAASSDAQRAEIRGASGPTSSAN
jgi:hypothetical protein